MIEIGIVIVWFIVVSAALGYKRGFRDGSGQHKSEVKTLTTGLKRAEIEAGESEDRAWALEELLTERDDQIVSLQRRVRTQSNVIKKQRERLEES